MAEAISSGELSEFSEYDDYIRNALRTRHNVGALYKYQRYLRNVCALSLSPLGTPTVLARDICCYVPTGCGKTLAYVLPVLDYLWQIRLAHRCVALVLLPTNELVNQTWTVFSQMRSDAFNFSCLGLCGLAPLEYEFDVLFGNVPKVERSEKKYLYFGPQNSNQLPHVLLSTVSRIGLIAARDMRLFTSAVFSSLRFIVFDEIDKLLDISMHNWTLLFDRLLAARRESASSDAAQCSECEIPEQPVLQRILLSATEARSTLGLNLLKLERPMIVRASLQHAQNSKLKTIITLYDSVSPELLAAIVQRILTKRPQSTGKCLVFVNKIETCRLLADAFAASGVAAVALTNAAGSALRLKTMLSFRNDPEKRVLISTDLASRGLHIENIRWVVNYKLPNSVSNFIHRIGRTARATRRGKVYVVDTVARQKQIEKFMRSTNSVRALQYKLKICA